MTVRFKYEQAMGTPKGRAFFPAFNQPDTFKGTAKYKGGVILDPDNIPADKKFVDNMNKLLATRVKQWLAEEIGEGGSKFTDHHTINDLFAYQTDKEGEYTGKLIFTPNSKDFPTFEDAKGTKLTANFPIIKGGDIIRTAFQCQFYVMPGDPIKQAGKPPIKTAKVGLAKYLKAVRLIEPMGTGGYGDAFGGEDEGYEHDDSAFDNDGSAPESNDTQDDF